MILSDIRYLWHHGSHTRTVPGKLSFKARLNLVRRALPNQDLLRQLQSAPSGSALSSALQQRPDLVGAFIWPYLCAAWEAERRLSELISHHRIIDELGLPFSLQIEEELELCDLSEYMEDAALTLDRPAWFMREGQLVMNIVVGDFRAYSIAFSFSKDDADGLIVRIGAIQGRSTPDAMELYRTLTKKFHGARPRDFLMEQLRLLSVKAGATRLLAIRDDYRHHRHPYFGDAKNFEGNYDEIWKDRGATPFDEHFVALPLEEQRRDPETISPKKRAKYRRRYAMMDEIIAKTDETLTSPVVRAARELR